MSTTFKSSLIPHLVKTFVMLMIVMFAVRYGEQFLFGDAVMATYKIVLALPVVVTLLVWLSERTSIREVVIAEDGIRVTAYSGDTVKVTWISVTEAIHSRPREVLLTAPYGNSAIRQGRNSIFRTASFPERERSDLTTLITDHLPENKVVIVSIDFYLLYGRKGYYMERLYDKRHTQLKTLK